MCYFTGHATILCKYRPCGRSNNSLAPPAAVAPVQASKRNAYPHVSRGVHGGSASAGGGSTALGDASDRKPSQGVPGGALASTLIEPFLLLFFADLNLRFAAPAASLVPAHAGFEKLGALKGGTGRDMGWDTHAQQTFRKEAKLRSPLGTMSSRDGPVSKTRRVRAIFSIFS